MQFSTDCYPPNFLLVIPFHDNDGWTQCGLSHNYNAFINIGTINVFYIVLLIFFCSVIFYVYLNIIQSTPTCLVIKCSKVICTTRSPSLFLILSAASKLSYRSSASRLFLCSLSRIPFLVLQFPQTLPAQCLHRSIHYHHYIIWTTPNNVFILWSTRSLDTHEKKNTYKNLFVLILYYILAKWLYL